jgi:hypothetical protein
MNLNQSELYNLRSLDAVKQWEQIPTLVQDPDQPDKARLLRIFADYAKELRYRLEYPWSEPYSDDYDRLAKLKATCREINLAIDTVTAVDGAESNPIASGIVAYLFSIASDLVLAIEFVESEHSDHKHIFDLERAVYQRQRAVENEHVSNKERSTSTTNVPRV